MDGRELDYDVRKQLLTLAKDTAELVARHLVMAGRLMDDEPESALAHARAARALAGRVGAVREANGLVAYTAGEWAEALTELRTARRITGDPEHLAVMADCERALGRPDRALMVADDPQVASLSPAAKLELLIVSSGARRDMGQAEAAVVSLQVAALDGPVRPWTARLRYAYADALLDAGRTEDARLWFGRTADADEDGSTDAVDRLLEMDGIVMEDHQAEDEPDDHDGNHHDVATAHELQQVAQRAAEVGASYVPVAGEVAGGSLAGELAPGVVGQGGAVAAEPEAHQLAAAAQPSDQPPVGQLVRADELETSESEVDHAAAARGPSGVDTPLAALERALTLSEEAARATGLTFSGAAGAAAGPGTDGASLAGTGALAARSPEQLSESGSVAPGQLTSVVGGAPPFVEPVVGTDVQRSDDEPDLRLFD